MIGKKVFNADGVNTRFLSDFIIQSEQFARVYAYIYDDTLNPDGTEDKLQDGTTDHANWVFPTNVWKRGADAPNSAQDLLTIEKWDLVNNSIATYLTPLAPTKIWIEVATTPEEFGSTLIQPTVAQAEAAADLSIAAKDAAIVAQTAAETAQAAAEAAKVLAQTAQTGSETAQAASEAAKVLAQTAQAAAETAQAAAETAQAAAEAAQTAAASSASAASASASAASASAAAALASESAAAASASAAGVAQTAAEAAQAAAELVYDAFDDRYLGDKASDPTLDNDGDPLITGALYWNTAVNKLKIYDGATWEEIGGGGAVGGGTDKVFIENGQTITTDYTISANSNAMSTGNITINTGVTVTVPDGARWVIV